MKIVVNKCYGGFGLSHEAVMEYAKLKGITLYAWLDDTDLKYNPEATFDSAMFVHYATIPKEDYDKHNKLWHETAIEGRKELGNGGYFSDSDIDRDDPALIEVVQKLGKKASGRYANLVVVEIPDDVEWGIEEYDGIEWIAEKHRTW